MLRLTIVDKMVVVAFVFICEMLRKLGIMKRLDNYRNILRKIQGLFRSATVGKFRAAILANL